MADETRTLGFGVTYDMAAAQSACGQLLSLTSHRPNDELPPHRHVNSYLCMVLRGNFAEMQGAACRERQTGCYFVHEAGDMHFDRIGSGGAMCLNMHFAAGDVPTCKSEGSFSALGKIAADRLAYELAAATHDELVVASLAAEIMAAASDRQAGPVDDGDWLIKVVEAIADEPRRRWSLHELARIADRHPVRLAQAFRVRTGLSLGAFQRLRRLTCLNLAIRRENLSLPILAADFGYCDQAHMNSEFRTAFGISPGRYRRESH